jgi:hypothetical protein
VHFTGERGGGYVMASHSVSPENLVIAGPASHVARVQAAVTDPVNVSSVVGTSQFRVNAFVSDPYVRFQTTPQVAVTVAMRKK